MPLSTKLTVLSSILFLFLIALSNSIPLRIAYSLFMVFMGISLFSAQETLRRQLDSHRKELERVNRTCDELDENTKLIVQTDLELTRTQEALDKKLSGLYALHRLSRRILSVRSVAELCRIITEAAVSMLGFEKAILCIVNPEKKSQPLTVAHSGFEEEEARKLDLAGLIRRVQDPVFSPGDPLVVPDMDSKEGINGDARELSRLVGIRSYAVVPLILRNHPQGFLLAGTNPPYPKLDSGDVELTAILMSEVGVAIENLQLYEDLKRSHDELEERVKARTRELAKANEELVRLNKMKSDFVSAVSHELRTPLTSIKGYTSLVRSGKLGPVSQDQSERLEKIIRHTDTLSNLITDLLDIARIESGRVGMTIKPISLPRLLETVSDLLAPQLKEKELTLAVNLPPDLPLIQADENRLQRVFVNLLSNAIKFTPLKGSITVEGVKTDSELQMDVKDTGIGIPPEDLPKIFSEFFRVDNAVNRERKGTGLGLVLVKRIVEAHGGRIWAASQPGKGTIFHFALPWKPAAQPAMGIP